MSCCWPCGEAVTPSSKRSKHTHSSQSLPHPHHHHDHTHHQQAQQTPQSNRRQDEHMHGRAGAASSRGRLSLSVPLHVDEENTSPSPPPSTTSTHASSASSASAPHSSLDVDRLEYEANKQINKQLRVEMKKMEQHSKLLLLGPASSGKSTVFKQAISLYGSGFDEVDRRAYVPLIHHSIVMALRTLLTHAYQFVTPITQAPNSVLSNSSSPSSSSSSSYSSSSSSTTIDQLSPSLTPCRVLIDSVSDEQPLTQSEVNTAIEMVWRDPLIQRCWQHHTQFHLPECIPYFMSRFREITAPNYLPTLSDILRVRAPTSGIIERTFSTNDELITIVDVGGQRSERRKWIHCFERVKAVIFVAAISEYDQQLEEDSTQNRLVESFELFDFVVNSKYFSESAIILFLNKSDLFAEKLPLKPFAYIFPKYKGPNEYEEVLSWLQRKFESRNQDFNKKIFVHVTCAINPDNFRVVFEAVRLTVRNIALKHLKLM